MNEMYRLLPKMDELLARESILHTISEYGRNEVLNALREILDEIRELITSGLITYDDLASALNEIDQNLIKKLKQYKNSGLRRVINATGIMLHTNLGRSPLAEEAITAVVEAAKGYSNLEYDLDTGERGERLKVISDLICEITGAEDATVVNNNAAAVLISLSALARNREVVISRGELVEIGGSFRIPDVMLQSGAILREVGTTNKTRIKDYENAINENTAAVMKVHTSNFRITGFTESVSTEDLVNLCRQKNLLAIEDLGSGMFIDGFDEPTVQRAISSGLDIVTFSGDKLLGGPQAGIIAGKARLISKISKHPLFRALRIDKMTLAALESTLKLYRFPETHEKIPIVRMLNLKPENLSPVCYELCEKINVIPGLDAKVIETSVSAGGGSLPGKDIYGFAVAVASSVSSTRFAKALRHADIPVIVRIAKDYVLIEPRTLLPHDFNDLLSSLRQAARLNT